MRRLISFAVLLFITSQLSAQSWKELNKTFEEYYYKGNYQAALEYAQKALRQAEVQFGAADSNYAESLNNLAVIYTETGKFEKALPLLHEALEICEKTFGKEHRNYGVFLNNLASFYFSTGRYDEALPLFKAAFENAEKSLGKNDVNYWLYLTNLAQVSEITGRYEDALRLLSLETRQQMAKILGKDHPVYGRALNSLAILYEAMGRYEDALPLAIRSLENCASSLGKDHFEYGTGLNNLAGLYRKLGRYEEALSIMFQALQNTEKSLGKNHSDYGKRLHNIAGIYREMGRYDEALSTMLDALKNTESTLGKNHSDYGIGLYNLARLYRQMGRYDEALPLLHQSLENCENSFGKDHAWYGAALNGLAQLHAQMGCPEEALPLYLAANENLHRQIEQVFTISAEKNKADFLNTVENRFQQYLTFAFNYQSDTLHQTLYDNELALKGLILNSTKNVFLNIEKSHDTTLTRKFAQWKDIRNQLAKEYSKPINRRNENCDSLERIANLLEEGLVLSSAAYEKLRRKVEWRDVQNSLNENEAAIEFVHFRNSNDKNFDSIFYAALVVRPDYQHPKFVYLFEERQLRDLLKRADEKNDKQFIAKIYGNKSLYELLWQPLELFLDDVSHVYFAPSGILHSISFAAIPSHHGSYLFQQYQLVQMSSTRELAMNNPQPQFTTAALYGGILYEYDSTKKKITRANPALTFDELSQKNIMRSGQQFLSGSLNEINSIAGFFRDNEANARVRSGASATEADFKSLSGHSPKVIHVSTHGFFFPDIEKMSHDMNDDSFNEGAVYRYAENPLFRCGLAFAGSNLAWETGFNPYEKEDGILTAYEISQMDLSNTDLVVLSACETGLGEIKGSEGVYGLQRAFKMAGAEYIIMSLWKVPDEHTQKLMGYFYSDWLQGESILQAFRNAQTKMSESYHPYFWGAFVLVGGGKKQVEFTESSNIRNYIIFGGAIFMLVVVGVFVRKFI